MVRKYSGPQSHPSCGKKASLNMDLKHCYGSPVRWCLVLVAINVAAVGAIADEAADRFFDQQVAPLLIRRCIQCHNGFDLKGKLDLSTREGALKGGESGPSIHVTYQQW